MSGPAVDGGRVLRARHLVVAVVAAVFASVIVVSAFGRVTGFSELADALDDADPRWLVLCVIGQFVVFSGYAGAVRHATTDRDRDSPVLTAWGSVRIVLASFAATQVFAFGGVGGLALLYWTFRRQGRDHRDALVTLIGLNTAVYLVFGAVAAVAGVAALGAGTAPAGMTVPWIVAVPMLVVAAGWFTAPRRVARWTEPTAGRIRDLLAIGVGAAAWTRHRLGGDPLLFLWAGLYWIGDLVSLAGALRAFDSHIGPAALAVAYATGYLAQSLPIPLIATAGVDAATTATLHAVGVPLEAALLGVVAHRVFAFWLPVIPGSVVALTLPAAPPFAHTQPSSHGEPGEPRRTAP